MTAKRGVAFTAAVVLSLVSSACRPEAPFFPPGTPRAKVHEILGAPANSDPQIVSVWLYGAGVAKEKSGPWRQLLKEHRVKFIAAFDTADLSLMPLVAPEATLITSEMSDAQVLEAAALFSGVK